MWEKKTIKCDKKTITYDVSTTQYNDETVKCEKKIKALLNVRKVWSKVMLVLPNVTMEPSNVWKKKIKESPNGLMVVASTECDGSYQGRYVGS